MNRVAQWIENSPLGWALVLALTLAAIVLALALTSCESVTPAENTYTHKTTIETDEFSTSAPQADNAPTAPAPAPPAGTAKKKITTELTLTSKGAGSATAFAKSTADSKAGALTPPKEEGPNVTPPGKDDAPAAGESGGGILAIVGRMSHGGSVWMFIGALLMVGCAIAALAFKFPMFWWGTAAGALFFALGWVMDFAPWVIWVLIALGALGAVLLVFNGKAISDIWAQFKTVVVGIAKLPPAAQEPVRAAVQEEAGGKNSPADEKLKEYVAAAKKENAAQT